MNKRIISFLVLSILIVLSSALNTQAQEYTKQIEQWDEDLYMVTLSNLQGNYKSYELFKVDPESIEMVFDQGQPTDVIGDDILQAKMTLPDDLGGIKPYDVCVNPNFDKIYVYGNQGLMIINSITHQVMKTIHVSNVGDLSTASVTTFPKTRCLVYDFNNDRLYCATLGRELKVIDGDTDELITSFNMYENINQIIPNLLFIPTTNRVYWINSFYFQGARVKVIDTDNLTVLSNIFFNEGYLYDIELNLNEGLCYAAIGNDLKFINTLDFSTVQSINTGQINELVYNASSDKIYGTLGGTNQLVVVDGTSGNLYPQVNLPASHIKNGCSNEINDKIYLTAGNGPPNAFRMIGIDCTTDQVIFNYPVPAANSLYFSPSNNKVYCGGKNILKTIDGTTNSVLNTASIDGCKSRILTENTGTNELISIEFFEHTISYFNNSGNHISTEDIGGAIHLGCYNTNNNKVYFIKDFSSHINSYIDIWDGQTNTFISKVPIGDFLTDLCYNSESNKIFVSAKESGFIKVLDGASDQVLQTINGITANSVFSYKNKVYCCTGSSIKIVNADNYQITTINCESSNHWSAIEDEENDRVFISCNESDIVYVIDYISNSILYELNTPDNINDITFNSLDNKLYTSNKNGTVSIFDTENYQLIINFNQPGFTPKFPIVYGLYSNTVYVNGTYNNVYPRIQFIDGESNASTGKIIPNGRTSGLFYNNENNMLYIHLRYSYYGDMQMVVEGYECTEYELTQLINLENYQKPGVITIFSDEEKMPFNTIDNKLYCGNLGFANVSAIKIGEDKLGLNYSWRWISFPRMERYALADEPFPPVPIMKNTTLYDEDLYFTLWAQPQPNVIYKRFNPTPPDPWSGLLYEVKSTKGYKYEGPPTDDVLPEPYQTLKGARLYPECPVELPVPGEEKWIGYFIEESQDPWDAFSADIYNGADGLTMIKAQYWTMFKICNPNGNCAWLSSGKVSPIKYGDMVIIKYNGSDPNFVWNNPDNSKEDREIPKPQAYTWEEKADYIPFYVETDPASDIEEIAVLVDGECMGATVRQAGDTLVEVDGYLGELPVGAVVEFETWNGYKSIPVERNAYVVYDPSTDKKEKRNIYVGENQDYYLVSLKAGEVYEQPDDVSHISCQPNPFSNEITMTMRLNSAQFVAVEVYNIQGVKVKTLLNSNLPGGYYEVVWNGDNESGNKVKEGVYFYKIKTGNGTEITDKIVILK